MATEIERKYLVVDDAWRSQAVGTVFRQGYLLGNQKKTHHPRVRCGRARAPDRKRASPLVAVRSEFEHVITGADADQLLDGLMRAASASEKTRCKSKREGRRLGRLRAARTGEL